MRKIYISCLLMLLFAGFAWAQPSNDNCDNPIVLPDVSDWCSNRAAYTNVGATPSGYGAASCFREASNDVWFTFVAGATDITILVKGDVSTAPGGTLRQPEVALYTANCGGEVSQLRCDADQSNSNLVESYKGGLVVGQAYLIRVQGRGGNTGTFQLCINNYNPPVNPGSDCTASSVLCDKSPFVVQKVSGAGDNNREIDDATCFSGGAPGNYETNSTWFTWICDEAGTLEFTLAPLKEDDDLDFVLYELPNGIDDCRNKTLLRCMASGDFNYPSPCMGPTGLKAGETDLSEPAGCNNPSQNSFLAPLNMVSGRAYALVINNFSATGNGFSIEFGGTGTFLGPRAEYEVDFSSDDEDNIACVGEEITFTDISQFPLGSIIGWKWTFGVGATPATATGKGPHKITYNSPGLKSVVLTVETELGCVVTEIGTFDVLPGVEITETLVQPDCGGGTNGSIELSVSGGAAPYFYSWNDSIFVVDDNLLDNLPEGDYAVVVKDNQGCVSEKSFELREAGLALDASVDPVIPPTCNGDSDGAIIIVATLGTPPYRYNFGNGFVNSNRLEGLAAGTYMVEVRDTNGCNELFTIEVEDPPVLMLEADPLNVSCAGERDGMVTALGSGGVEPYSYRWNTGQVTEQIRGLDPGDYSVTLQDANGCEVTAQASIIEPGGIFLTLDGVIDAACNGQASGVIQVSATGGTPPFQYRVTGGTLQPDPAIGGLLAGKYIVQVQDSRGCTTSLEAEVGEPNPISVYAGADVTIDLGFTTRLNATPFPPDRTYSFQWIPSDSLSCMDCANPVASPFNTTTYQVVITDQDNCTATDNVTINVLKKRPVYIPTAFSPDGDGKNDFFTLYSGPAAKIIKSLRIFDRWGDLLFEGKNLDFNADEQGWDGMVNGKVLPPGVFAYFAEVEFVDGLTLVYEGDVTIVR